MALSGSRAGPRLRGAVVGVLLLAVGGAVATRGFAAPSAGCLGERATITGSATIIGTEGDDVIVRSAVRHDDGKGGDDVVCGLGGNDVHLGAGSAMAGSAAAPATTGSAATSGSRAVAVYRQRAVATTSSMGTWRRPLGG
jgi:hypothetical protein